MCGICGKVSWGAPVAAPIVQRMMDAIAYRGPDDCGIYVTPNAVMGHRRLSIIDVASGHQPLSNEDQTVWVVFNGEIYNYPELRSELLSRGHHLATASDTEVIVHLYEDFGLQCIERLEGMFAFALWDTRQQRLVIARDRVGIKPLYYATSSQTVLFASEIKALLADSSVQRDVELRGIDRFLTYSYLPGPQTLLRGISKVEPGSYMVFEK